MEYPLCAVKEWEHLTLDQQLSWYLKPPQTLNLMCNLDRNWNMVNQLDLQEKIQIRQIINVANFWGGDTCIFVFLGYLNMRALSKSSSETSNTQDFHIPKKHDLKRNLLSCHCFLLPNYCVHNEVWGYMEILPRRKVCIHSNHSFLETNLRIWESSNTGDVLYYLHIAVRKNFFWSHNLSLNDN